YPDVATSCPWTSCVAGGTPAVTLSVNSVEGAATGSIDSRPAGIALAGSGEQENQFSELDIKLKARPNGAHARAVFSGDCVKTGDYGEAAPCKLTLGPDKSVTVTWECEP